MIQSGGWCRLRTQDEHTKLARVSIDLPSGGDELFELNISKTQVRIPTALRSELSAIASNVARLAQEVYRAPSTGVVAGNRSRMSSDPRVRAINSLVEMVVSATEALIQSELASTEARQLTARLREMQCRFAEQLEAELTKEVRTANLREASLSSA
jgi:hypothetical protein